MGGNVATKVKQLKGAALVTPLLPMVDIQAIGRGDTQPFSN
jgi:hypothetical protein